MGFGPSSSSCNFRSIHLLKCEIGMEVNITLAATEDTPQQQQRAFTDSNVHRVCSRQTLLSPQTLPIYSAYRQKCKCRVCA